MHGSLHQGIAVGAVLAAAGAWMVGVSGSVWATDRAGVRAAHRVRCAAPALGAVRAAAAVDGRTLRLADGRELRLAGIEAPRPGDAAAHDAAAALQSLAAGRELALFRLGPDTDRYGRLTALVRPAAGAHDREQTLQLALLAAGHARVAARIGDVACAREMLAAERKARAAGLGLWQNPHYFMQKAEEPAKILALRGLLAVVEGKVLSVRASGAHFYLNFGRRWSDDFTVTTLKQNARKFAAAGLELTKLAGRHVRVRGTIEERGGPWIEAMHPEQIEIAERD